VQADMPLAILKRTFHGLQKIVGPGYHRPGFLALHLIHFWSKMQLVELMHGHNYAAAGYHESDRRSLFHP
jgi:hypothetical protein